MFQNLSVKGEAHPLAPTEFIPAGEQREIMSLLMDTMDPKNLEIPESVLLQLAPDPGRNLEDLSSDPVFDQLKAARILAATTIQPLFDPNRAARLVSLAARKPDTLTLPELVDTVMAHSWKVTPGGSAEQKALLRVVQNVVMQSMMALGGAKDSAPEAKDYVLDQLNLLADDLKSRQDSDPLTAAFYRESARQITHYLTIRKPMCPRTSCRGGEGDRAPASHCRRVRHCRSRRSAFSGDQIPRRPVMYS